VQLVPASEVVVVVVEVVVLAIVVAVTAVVVASGQEMERVYSYNPGARMCPQNLTGYTATSFLTRALAYNCSFP